MDELNIAKISKWIMLVTESYTGKTYVWIVIAKEGNLVLGCVKWFGRWRGYAFFPENNTVFEPTCLMDITEFIIERNNLHRKHLKIKRQNRSEVAQS
jgi:hypothetical protein